MGTACILDGLCSEEEVLRSLEVELAIFGDIGWFLACRVFEEEYDAVDRTIENVCVRWNYSVGSWITRTFVAAEIQSRELQALQTEHL